MADEPGLISCVLFPVYREDPLLVLTNVNDMNGFATVRTMTPELCTDSLCECGCVRSGLAVVVRW